MKNEFMPFRSEIHEEFCIVRGIHVMPFVVGPENKVWRMGDKLPFHQQSPYHFWKGGNGEMKSAEGLYRPWGADEPEEVKAGEWWATFYGGPCDSQDKRYWLAQRKGSVCKPHKFSDLKDAYRWAIGDGDFIPTEDVRPGEPNFTGSGPLTRKNKD